MPDSVFKVPRVPECIKYIETTYGGCKYLGSHINNHVRYYRFLVPAKNWDTHVSFSTNELRFTFLNGW